MRKSKFDQDLLFEQGLRGCNRCLEIKKVSFFYKTNSTKQGLHTICKSCIDIVNKEYRKNNPEANVRYTIKSRKKHPETVRNWMNRNYEKLKPSVIEWKKNNRQKVVSYVTKSREKARNNLSDSYLKSLLLNQFDLKSNEITAEMIMLKKVEIKCIKYIKTQKV